MNTGFLFCVCPDAALLKDTVNAFFASEGYASSDRLVFWGDEGLSPRFWEALTLQGLVSAHKCLTVRNAQLLPAETWKALSKSLGHPHEQALPVFCLEGPWEKGRPKLPAWLEKLKASLIRPGADGKASRMARKFFKQGDEKTYGLDNSSCPKRLTLCPCGNSRSDGYCEANHAPCVFKKVVELSAAFNEMNLLE